jgi:hypothetical protein
VSSTDRSPRPDVPGRSWATAFGARAVERVRDWFRVHGTFPLSLFISTRIALMMTSFMGLTLFPRLFFQEGDRQRALLPYPWIDGLCRWDCGWFDRVVRDGYADPENAKILPLFPLIGWLVERATGLNHLFVFLITANLASLIAYYVIFHMFRELEGEEAAKWALLLFAAYPFAFFQASAYPESLMVLFSSLALLLALRKRHIWAGVALGFGVMARHISLFGGAGMVAAQVRQRGWRPRALLWNPAVLGLFIPFIFIGLFAWHLKVKLGDPLTAFVNARNAGWNDWNWYGVRQAILNIPYNERPEYFFYMFFAIIPTVGAVLSATRKKWIELAADGLLLMIVVLSTGVAALGRYSASCWPAFLPLGVQLAKRPALRGPLVVGLAVVQGFFFFLFSHQYRIF